MKIRLQKRIAENGVYSRRQAERLMQEGKVKVNGEVVTELGTKVDLEDEIQVHGNLLEFAKPMTVLLNKPKGYLTSRFDPHHNDTVMKLLPKKYQHLKPVGRLDKATEGLLLLSSDGELIQRLTHPKHGHSKTYELRVRGHAKDSDLMPLESGKLKLDDYTLNPMEFEILDHDRSGTYLRLKLTEGRNRQIRRVMENLGFPVLYLKRTQLGLLDLGDLAKGKYRVLNDNDIRLALHDS